MDMVERVAARLWFRYYTDYTDDTEYADARAKWPDDETLWSTTDEDEKERFLDLARSAIAVMHEPTPRMAGTAGLLTIRIGDTDQTTPLGYSSAELVWRYMIERALDNNN